MSRILTDFGVVAIPALSPTLNRASARVLPGATLAECLDKVIPEQWGPSRRQMRVTVNGHVVLPGLWDKVRPKAGTAVLIEVVPGDSKTLRSVLTIAVAIAAVAAGQFYGVGLSTALFGAEAGAGTLTASLTSAALSTTILTAGTLLINAFIPIRNDKEVPVYTINSLRNRATPDGVLPVNNGKNRIAPVYAMLPWSEVVGDDRYINALMVFSRFTNKVSGLQFGETDINRFQGIQVEVREGYATDLPHTICDRIVIEKSLNIGLQFGGPLSGPQYRVTARDVTDASIDIGFPSGLGGVREDGDPVDCTVSLSWRYRKVGTDVWSQAFSANVTANKMSVAFSRTFPMVFPERGQYEIEVVRTNGDYDFPEFDSTAKTKRTGRSFWTAIRSFRPEYPIAFKGPLTTVALRMRANAQLNGTIDEVNAIVSSVCEVINPTTGAITYEETNNPASLYRRQMLDVMTYPLARDEIDEMREFYQFCKDQALSYNRWVNNEISVLDIISEICATGRASPHDTGEKWDVVIDRPSEMVAAHISPDNSYEFSAEISYVQFPHAFRVSFQDETNNYSAAERIIRWPGYDGEITITEALDLVGYTNPTQVWKEARRRQYEVIHRATTYRVKQDIENLTVQRGDRVLLNHDLLDDTLMAGRVTFVGGGDVSGWHLALTSDVEMEAGFTYGARYRRKDGVSVSLQLRTIPGISSDIYLIGNGPRPDEGDLIFVGIYGSESFPCTVQQIERMDKFTAELTLKDHAPQIQALLDADVVPVWDGRVGKPIEGVNDTPNAPTITDVVSGALAASAATASIPYPVLVTITMPAGSRVRLGQFQVRHRKIGMPGYTITTVSSGNTRILLSGYAKGDLIEASARAVSLKGTPGPYGEPNITHTVGATDIQAPVNLAASIERGVNSAGQPTLMIRLTSNASARSGAFLVGQYRASGTTPWKTMGFDTEDRFSVLSGTIADKTNYEVRGAISSSGGSELSGFLAASGSPIQGVADTNAPSQPTYTSAVAGTQTINGSPVTHSFKQSPSDNAKTVKLSRANGFGKLVADATQILSENLAPNQTDTFSDIFDIGYAQWFLQAANASGVFSTAAVKFLLNLIPFGNLFTQPYDLTANWTRSAVLPVQSGTGPDGNPSTLVQETATQAAHRIDRAITGLTSPSKIRTAFVVKASGRTRVRVNLHDASLGSNVGVFFDLAAGTSGTVTSSGTLVTGGIARIEKVSADYFLITLTGTVASTGATVRLLIMDDAGSTSYLGDTAKGVFVTAATIAVVN